MELSLDKSGSGGMSISTVRPTGMHNCHTRLRSSAGSLENRGKSISFDIVNQGVVSW